jgi:hypothetical protein
MKACFKYIAQPEALKLKREEFIKGVAKLYEIKFSPPTDPTKKKKKKKSSISRQSSETQVETNVDLVSPNTPLAFEIEKLIFEEKKRKLQKQQDSSAEINED